MSDANETQVHFLHPRHHQHLNKVGVGTSRTPYLSISKGEYERHYADWERSLPNASKDELHSRTLAHWAWEKQSIVDAGKPQRDHQRKRYEWWVIVALLLLILFSVVPHAHCQFSKINTIQTNNQGSQVGFHASPFVINCSTNMTCADDGTTLTFSSSGGGAATGYQTLQNATTAIAQETVLNWTAGIVCVDNAEATRSDCALSNITAVSHKFFNSVVSGALVLAQPDYGDLTGTPQLAQTLANASHKWLNSYTASTGLFTQTQPDYSDLTGVPSTFAPAAHNLLSASHGDTTAAAAVRGDGLFAIGATPTWQRLAHPATTGGYFKWNGTDVVASSLAASGTGSPTACTNQTVTGFTLNADAAPTSTCTTITSAFTSGTFSATAHNLLSATHGDTVTHSVVLGDVLFGNSTPAWAALAGQTTSTKEYLSQTGTGTVSAAPAWAQVAYADLSGTPQLPVTKASVASNWLNSYTSSTGLFTATQPAFTDISGSVAAAQMPALTGAVTTSAGAVATSPGKIDVLDSSRFCQAAGASSTTYTCNLSPAITAYVTGTHYGFKADVANTAASTINLNGQGAKTIKKAAGGITTDIAANDMQAGQWVDLVYDGTNMQMQSTLGNAGGGTGTVTSIATTSPITGGTITTTGTIACATCVTSSSPGVGIAHFAGSTQAVTSSAVDLSGADATGVLAAARFPALTGDITTVSGALATTLAASIPGAHAFSTSITAKSLENCLQLDGVGYSTLAAALTALGSTVGSICVSTNISLGANATVPSTAALVFQNGGMITQSAAFTLAINGPIQAAQTSKIFSGFAAGQVTFGQNSTVYPEWWGAVPDGAFVTNGCAGGTKNCFTGTNNDAAILSAVQSLPTGTTNPDLGKGGIVDFPQSAIYMMGSSADCTAGASTSAGVNSLIQVPDHVHFWGQGQLDTVLMQLGPATNCNMFVNALGTGNGNWGAGFHSLRIDGNELTDVTHFDNVFHPNNNNSTNTSGCAIYWNTAYRTTTTDAPSLILDDVYISGTPGTTDCAGSAVLIYGNGFVMSRNLRIGYNQWAHGMWFKASDSAFDKLYMVANGGWNSVENLVVQAGADNRFFNGYMGGGDGGTAQVWFQGSTNNKWVGMTDDLACGVDLRFTDFGGTASSFNTVTGGQISRPGGGCSTQKNGISFEGAATNNTVTGVLLQAAAGGSPIAVVETGTAGNNSIVGNIFSGWTGGANGLRQFSGTQWQANVGAGDTQAISKFVFVPSTVSSASYNLPAVMPAPTAAPTIACSNSGGSLAAGTYFVEYTFNNTTSGETTVSPESSCVTTGASGSVTVTAPVTLPPNSSGYTVYDFTSSNGEKQQAASPNCVNITGNCVITTVGAGAAVPSSNTASAGKAPNLPVVLGDVYVASPDGTYSKNVEQHTVKIGTYPATSTEASFNLAAVMPAPLVAPTISCSNSGGSLAAATYFVKDTFNNTASGETTASPEASCTTTGSSGSVTITAPSRPVNSTGYTVYDFTSTNTEKQQTASANCVNITANCVITVVATGAVVPVSNTASAGSTTPTVLAGDIGIGSSNGTVANNEEDHLVQTATAGAIKLYDSGGTNAITHTTSGTITSYTVNHPLAAATGVLTGVNSSNVITWAHSGDAAHSLSQLAKTAAVTTFTLCAATANTACGQAGQYRISYNFYGSGTACATVTAGSVGLNLTWTDTNAVTHTTISLPLWDQKSAAMTNGVFNFNTALGTESASGSYIISTNGTIIQAATTYVACTSGTGAYNLKMTVEQLQ